MRSLRLTVSLASIATICWGASYAYSRQKSNDTNSDSDEFVEIHLDPAVMKDAAPVLADVLNENHHVDANQRAH
jgi:hypothetical protein